MKYFFTATFIFLFFFLQVYSQSPVYRASDYANAGDNFIYTSVFRPTLNFYSGTIQKSGANQAWDFPFLYGLPQYDKEFYNPQIFYSYGASYLGLCGLSCYDNCFDNCTFPFGCNYYCMGSCGMTCASQWAGFNLAEKLLDDIDLNPNINFSLKDQFLILSKNNNSLKAGAIAATVNGMIPVVVPFNGQDKLLQFPMQFGSAHQSTSSFAIDLTPLNVNLAFNQQQTRNVEVTGYGTIRTPYQTYNDALQVRTRLSLEMTVNLNGTILTSTQFPSSLKPDDVIEYAWYVPGVGAPVFRAIGIEKDGITYFARVDYLDVQRWWWPYPMFSYMPNVNFLKLDEGYVGVQFINESKGASTYHWDFGDGSVSDEVDPLHVYEQGGWYVVTLTASKGMAAESYAERIFVPTKTSVDDELTSIQPDENTPVKDETSGIKVYPNPFNGNVNVSFVSPKDGKMTLELFDAYGKKIQVESRAVQTGQIVHEDMNLINSSLSSGIYFLRITINGWNKTVPLTKL